MSASQQAGLVEPETPGRKFDSKADFAQHVEDKFSEINFKPEANFSYAAEASGVVSDQEALKKVQHF